MSRVAERRKNRDIRNLENLKKIFEIIKFDGEQPATPDWLNYSMLPKSYSQNRNNQPWQFRMKQLLMMQFNLLILSVSPDVSTL